MKMTKPGKMIELTNSAQITAWRQRLDVNILISPHSVSFNRPRPRFPSLLIQKRSKRCTKSWTARIHTCTTLRKMRLKNERLWRILHALTSPTTWPVVTPRVSTARNANTRASGANTERRGKNSRRSLGPHLPRKFQIFIPSRLLNQIQVPNLFLNYYRTQNYGWRENYDTFAHNNSRVAICKRSFFNPGHLS
jgi:hypothetical protein